MAHLLYLALLACCLLVTAPLEIFLHTRVYARWRRLALALAPTFVIFAGWDVYAISAGWWSYNGTWITGIRIGNLPLEEALFFLVAPLCGVLTLEAVRSRRPGWVIGDELAPASRPEPDP